VKFVLRAAFRSLARNKLRSFLTTVGIIIGVGAVIAMVALGHGATVMVQIQIEQMGTNLILVNPGSSNRSGVKWGRGTIKTLLPSDAKAIKEECKAVAEAAPVAQGMAQCVYGDQNWGTTFYGTTPAYLAIRSWVLGAGEAFTEHDDRVANRVCLLGQTVVNRLFMGADPIGMTIRIRKLPFTVIGVLRERGANVYGDDTDDIVLIPLATAQRKLLGIKHLHTILVSAVSGEAIPLAKAQIEPLLRQRHGLPPNDEADFTLKTLSEIVETTRATLQILTIIFVIVASISLLVGGVGIMNIMLVSVTERTREIGIRRAIGARRRDILMQFLVESVVLSGMGGLLGVLAGIGSTVVMSHVLDWPTLVSPCPVIGAFSFSGAVGVFFGFYPAHKAAFLDPIDALRYE
jgi:putative ABC transport system permease protein